MGVRLTGINNVLRAGLVATLLTAALLPATPSMAASGRIFHRNDDAAGDSAPFDVDPDPCLPHRQRAVLPGQQDCYVRPNLPLRGNVGPRHPGSNAFGLQFDNGYD